MTSSNKSPRKPRSYKWFVQPHDKNTNDVIIGMPGVDRENDFGEVTCLDEGRKVRYEMWTVPGRSTVNSLKRSSEQIGLQFEVWVQEGSGSVRRSLIDRARKKKAYRQQQVRGQMLLTLM